MSFSSQHQNSALMPVQDPKAILANLKKEHNVKVCVWINPYISQRASIFKEGKEKGYFIKRTNGDTWQWDEWQPGMAIVDFTNKEAYKWYFDLIAGLCRLGVDTIKVKRNPIDRIWADKGLRRTSVNVSLIWE